MSFLNKLGLLRVQALVILLIALVAAWWAYFDSSYDRKASVRGLVPKVESQSLQVSSQRTAIRAPNFEPDDQHSIREQRRRVEALSHATPLAELYSQASGSASVESLLLRARILLTCLHIRQESTKPLQKSPTEAHRRPEPLLETSKRALAKLRQMSAANRCTEFAMPENAFEIANDLMRQAANRGSHVARVFLLESVLTQGFEPFQMSPRKPEMQDHFASMGSAQKLSPEQFEVLIGAIKSADPDAVQAAIHTLLSWYRESEVVFTGLSPKTAIDDMVTIPLAEILACRLGAACDADVNFTLLSYCAGGACDFRSVEDAHFSHPWLDPSRRIVTEHLVSLFENAYRTGDWSFIQLDQRPVEVPRPRTPFRPDPRFPRIGF